MNSLKGNISFAETRKEKMSVGVSICGKRLSKYIFYSSFSLLTFATKK